ncbi:MAG: DUF2312 domain-containing protein [Rubrimonas sp.]|uniref:DUF2312 domain-containing protein n=1 Tax=Rubrimonas sp. TaxID=2036015 RepID=UPI002FDDED2E
MSDVLDTADSVHGVTAAQLRQIVEKIERLEEERRALADDVKEIMAQAKSEGFDTKAIRKLIALRKKRLEERQEEEAILQTYMAALGML